MSHKEDIKTELNRQFSLIWSMPFDFNFFVATKDYVLFIEQHKLLTDLVDIFYEEWSKKLEKINKINFSDSQKREEIKQQGKLNTGYAYWQLLHVYHAVNWIMDRKIPEFQFQYARQNVFRDMQRVQNKEPKVFQNDYSNIFWSHRNDFRNYLQQLHNSLMTSLLSTKEGVEILPTLQKIIIVIDSKKGIYQKDKPEKVYKIKNPSGRFSIIMSIGPKQKVSINELGKNTTLTMKEIREINSNFRIKLGVVSDLIVHVDTGGYSLNTEEFKIEIN